MIIDPRPMTVFEWTDQMALLLDRFGLPMKLSNAAAWRDWANIVVEMIGLSSASVNPYGYDDWKAWAIKFSDEAESVLT